MVDARSTGRFNGTDPEPRPDISSGHMPGAFSVPFINMKLSFQQIVIYPDINQDDKKRSYWDNFWFKQ